MPPVKTAAAASLAAILVSACSTAVKPPQGRGRVDDPRLHNPDRVACLKRHRLPVALVGETGIQIGALPAGPSVRFLPTPGAAQAVQIAGEAQGAEVIGSALLYPPQASDNELTVIENCLAEGVAG
jgi:hypothetical protein